jgi:MscS family membrane protein
VHIWKIASVTIEQTPTLYGEFGYGPLERWLPPAFFDFRFLEVQLWQWLALLVLVSLAWLASMVLSSTVTRLLHRLSSRPEATLDDRIILLARGPLRLAVGVGLFAAGRALLGLSLGAEQWLQGLETVAIILAAAWAVMRFTDLGALALRERLIGRGQSDALPIVQPSQRAVKVLLAGIALLAILNSLGVNVTAVVAGLGVGGIAVALAAQKTIENLFGGVTLFADQPVRVGDFCRFGDMVGTVEEIGLRSTRIRTLDRTLVSIPNAEFSQLHLENFAKRDRIRLYTVIGVRYETTPDQLRYLLAHLREMLLAHPMISPDPARVRLVAFGAYSIDLEVFAYARTSDWNEFLAIREDIYLRTMDIVEEAGTGFAFPSSTTYIGRDDGIDEKRSRRAAERVEAWRAEGKLPFPNFPDDFGRGVEDTLDWPPAGSAGGPRGGDGDRHPRVETDKA